MKKQLIVSVTAKQNKEVTTLWKNLTTNNLCGNSQTVDIKFIEGNTRKLTMVYNDLLVYAKQQGYSHVFFIHDDVELRQNISSLDFNNYAVVGLAGSNNITVKSPFMWHLVSEPIDRLGAVAHTINGNSDSNSNYQITSFGTFNKPAVLIDGVFIGIDMAKWVLKPVWFDEKIPSFFHFYDLVFSFDCNLNGLRVGVVDFPITHKSPGLNKDFEIWGQGEKYTLTKYSKYIGKKIVA